MQAGRRASDDDDDDNDYYMMRNPSYAIILHCSVREKKVERPELLDFSLSPSFPLFCVICLCLACVFVIFRTFRIFPINLIKCVCSFVYATICVGIACSNDIYTLVFVYI